MRYLWHGRCRSPGPDQHFSIAIHSDASRHNDVTDTGPSSHSGTSYRRTICSRLNRPWASGRRRISCFPHALPLPAWRLSREAAIAGIRGPDVSNSRI
jgi:hypothetical protein